MKEQFIPYELALKLKELGFDEECLACYYEDKTFAYHPDSDVFVDAPLWQQASKFLYDNSKSKINFIIEGSDNYKRLSQKLKQSIKDFRNL